MEQKQIYSDFSVWEKYAIRTKSGLIFAPDDLVVRDGLGHQKEFFTWKEAMELEESVLKPAGWRLPTMDEWKRAVFEFRSAKKIRSALDLGLNGIIEVNLMDSYNYRPRVEIVAFRGIYGLYRSSTTYQDFSKKQFLSLYLDSSVAVPFNNSEDKGYSVRCVLNQ